MQPSPVRPLALALGAALLAAACSPDAGPTASAAPAGASLDAAESGVAPTGHFMILGKGGSLPANLEARVTAAGGRITTLIPEIGVAFAEPVAPGFAEAAGGIAGVESVVPDLMIQYEQTQPSPEAVDAEAVEAEAASLGDDETFYSFQWAPAAVHAPEAWNAGYRGQGARVAILDGAIYSSHVDLAGNLDVASSRSFVPGFAYNQDVGTFWHGTHVAGIVAARDNAIGTVGIAPSATLIGVKVLHNGSGAFEWILNGIIYAATPSEAGGGGADVINMSLGATFDYRGSWGDPEFRKAFRELQKAFDRGTRYAWQQGVTTIVSAGNDGHNYDVDKNLFKFPAQNQHVIGVSSTGPIGWARGASNFSTLAYYSDHGKSLVEIGAPGGNAALLVVNGDGGSCTKVGTFRTITNPCYVFDMVMSTVRGAATATASYNWSQGTSMAAPAVTGVAALIVGKSGGTATPAQVRAALLQGAEDLGAPGNDAQYGQGFLNAWRSVQ